MISLKSKFVDSIVNAGVDPMEQSLAAIKTIVILNRATLISLMTLFSYSVLMFEIKAYWSSLICFLMMPVFFLNYWLVRIGKVAAAKIMYITTVLVLITFFSIYFGPDMGSEYWIIIMGGLSMVIFNKKSNAFRVILISSVLFVILSVFQEKVPGYLFIEQEVKELIRLANIFFIFVVGMLFSLILRFSSDDFEKKVKENISVLENKNQSLTDSINYAKRIQQAVLPNTSLQKRYQRNSFVLFEPKDIVSADFYWMYHLEDRFLFAIVDGSGTAVAGALISLLAHSLLTQCVEEHHLKDPEDIFERFKYLVQNRKDKWNDDFTEDLELTVCSYQWLDQKLKYASNGNIMYLFKHVNNIDPNDSMIVESDDRYVLKEIRKKSSLVRKNIFESEVLTGIHKFRKDDAIYLTTDGFANQIGGPQAKRLKSQRYKDLLMSVQHLNLMKQRWLIKDVMVNWKGKKPQVDDITLLGFKV